MHPTISSWLDKSTEELDELYRAANAGTLPSGDTQGTAILAGSSGARLMAQLVRLLAWRGKVFDLFPGDRTGVLVNKITPFGLRTVVAKVYYDTSWLDGRETIVIDYSFTSLVAAKIRDEIREVEPGVYLGKVWLGKRRVLDFALSASQRPTG